MVLYHDIIFAKCIVSDSVGDGKHGAEQKGNSFFQGLPGAELSRSQQLLLCGIIGGKGQTLLFARSKPYMDGRQFPLLSWIKVSSSFCPTPSLRKPFLWQSYRGDDQTEWFFSLCCHNVLCFFLPLSSFILIWNIIHNDLLICKGPLPWYPSYFRKYPT